MSRSTPSPPTRSGRLAATSVVVLLVAATGVIVWEPWHGPVVLSLSARRGIAAGDLLAVPLVALAARIGRARSPRRHPAGASIGRVARGRRVGPASAVVLGALLLVAAVVGLSSGGQLVPAGGGTLDGTVQHVAAGSARPVGAWSYLALTYDGATLRLFVNGTPTSSRPATGSVQASEAPLWLAGNHPYGEHFEGVIDDVRVYSRALSNGEILADMTAPVVGGNRGRGPARAAVTGPTTQAPAAGLVATYSFDGGSGVSVADDSGNGNVGRISGATWTSEGRHGPALSFDGTDDLVRVSASTSLDVGTGFTLSAWIRPDAPQSGWRAIVQREPDAFFLSAGSDLEGVAGWADDLLAGSVVAAAGWFWVVLVSDRGRWFGGRRWGLPVAAALLLVGCVVDAVLAPSATLFGPILLAAWFAASAGGRAEAAGGWAVAAALVAATAASLGDLAVTGVRMQADDGGLARSAALGVTLAVAGLTMLRQRGVTGQQSGRAG